MKTRAIIEFKDTYASMECQELGYQTKETALAIISPTGQILSSTPLFKKAYGSNTAHIDQLPFTIDTLNITAKGLIIVHWKNYSMGNPIFQVGFSLFTKTSCCDTEVIYIERKLVDVSSI